MYDGAFVTCSELVWQLGRSQPRLFRGKSSRWSVHLQRSRVTVLLQRAAAARGAMSSLIADLMEERLRSLQVIAESDEARAEVAEMIDIVHGYLT